MAVLKFTIGKSDQETNFKARNITGTLYNIATAKRHFDIALNLQSGELHTLIFRNEVLWNLNWIMINKLSLHCLCIAAW